MVFEAWRPNSKKVTGMLDQEVVAQGPEDVDIQEGARARFERLAKSIDPQTVDRIQRGAALTQEDYSNPTTRLVEDAWARFIELSDHD